MSDLLLHLTHHKCGTRWINSICGEVCLALGKRWQSASNPDLFGGNIVTFARESRIDFLSFTNARYECLAAAGSYRGFHVIRDPRDILVSSYFSSLKTHSDRDWPELTEHRCRLQTATEEDGLILELDFISDVFEALATWNYADERILEVRMEALMRDNYSELCRIFTHLGLLDENDRSTSSPAVQAWGVARLLINRLHVRSRGRSLIHSYPTRILLLQFLGIVHRNRFEAKARGRTQGEEDRSSHYRKGQAGDWVNHFTPRVEEAFKARHGALVTDLAYEESDAWTYTGVPSS